MPEDPEVEKLAQTLKSSGLAASWLDAVNQAKSILGKSNKGVPIRSEQSSPSPVPHAHKVDKIIEEVDMEIAQQKKQVVQQTTHAHGHNHHHAELSDPSFDITNTKEPLKDLLSDDTEDTPVFTNDPGILKKEAKAQALEKGQPLDEDGDPISMISGGESAPQGSQPSVIIEAAPAKTATVSTGQAPPKRPTLTEAEKSMADLTKIFGRK